jgi:hypothetical protein
MNDVHAIPTAPNPKLISRAAGRVRASHGVVARPSTTMTTRNPAVYRAPRIRAHPSSPREMSAADSGVDRIASNVFW